MELYVWLGAAGIALSCANLFLWHTRQTLKRRRQDLELRAASQAPAAAVIEMTPSVNAA